MTPENGGAPAVPKDAAACWNAMFAFKAFIAIAVPGGIVILVAFYLTRRLAKALSRGRTAAR